MFGKLVSIPPDRPIRRLQRHSRNYLSKVTIPTPVLQCSEDIIASEVVGKLVRVGGDIGQGFLGHRCQAPAPQAPRGVFNRLSNDNLVTAVAGWRPGTVQRRAASVPKPAHLEKDIPQTHPDLLSRGVLVGGASVGGLTNFCKHECGDRSREDLVDAPRYYPRNVTRSSGKSNALFEIRTGDW
jgi:hypothetical protein